MGGKFIGGGKVKIGVEAGCLGIKDERLKVGVYQVTFNLLQQLGKSDRKNEYLLYSFLPISKEVLSHFGKRMKNILVRPTFGWNYLALPLRLLKDKPDFFLGPSQSLPAFLPCPSIVIVHDLGYEHCPEFYKDFQKLRNNTQRAIGKASRIIAVSEFTKKDLRETYQISEEKISVAYEGIDPIFRPQPQIKIAKPYFLFVGALKKSKNIPRILQAFAEFLRLSKKDFSLVLAGGDLWLDKEIAPMIKKFGLKDEVKFLGFVPKKNLPGLYSGATAFVSPSLYEGFGLTLLEAMACGCPVIAANTGAQPEVIGEAGILIDPENVSEITRALIKIATDLNFRQKLIGLGLARAKKFSWKKFSEEIW